MIDDELNSIFVEEATELLEYISEFLESWDKVSNKEEIINPILGHLHTLKGGARMIGQVEISNFAHVLEQTFTVINENHSLLTTENYNLIISSINKLCSGIEALAVGRELPDFSSYLDKINSNIIVSSLEDADLNSIKQANEFSKDDIIVDTPQSSISDTVRLKVEQLEKMKILASNINVARANLHQDYGLITNAVMEMGKQIHQVKDQLKFLSLQLNINIQSTSNYKKKKAVNDFDFLELDRYSMVHQQAITLSENIDHINHLHMILQNTILHAEEMILKQGVDSRFLSETLTYASMVSVEHIVPRLTRIATQVALDLEKEVDFYCVKASGEVDRNMLQKLVTPLEHMIRNAIDHGIEEPIYRQKQNKPKQGNIRLSLVQSGNAVIIELKDDGRGMDVDKIKKTAITKNIITKDQKLSKDEIMRLTLQPGFSTKQVVTQISGRGIGLDSCMDHISSLGGTLNIQSEKNHGTCFTIRIPFVSSLDRALIFSMHQHVLAIIIENIAGVIRLPIEIIKEHIETKQPLVFSGDEYELFDLNNLLDFRQSSILDGSKTTFPVMFINENKHRYAIFFERIIGEREIIIKPLSTQLNEIQEIMGVSILSDGVTAYVLDPSRLYSQTQRDIEQKSFEDISLAEGYKFGFVQKKIMVVDDSSTVRRVTNKFLDKNGFSCLLAKDGVDALGILSNNTPDLILLDIEMPRMDGFEFLQNIGGNPKYKNIPVVVISSRSGEKHKNKALALGASRYMTKPYQENDLLFVINQLLDLDDG